jgi:hypothetical protein
MSKPSKQILQLPMEKRALIALKVAVVRAIDEHARLGLPVYVWRNGTVAKLSRKEQVILKGPDAKDFRIRRTCRDSVPVPTSP